MQKTKLGISVGLFGAALYFVGLFGGYIALILLTGYVLLCEEDEWLRKTSVKAVILLAAFSLITVIIGFIPDTLDIITSSVRTVFSSFSIPFIPAIFSIILKMVSMIKSIAFIIFGLMALKKSDVKISYLDNFVDKYMQ